MIQKINRHWYQLILYNWQKCGENGEQRFEIQKNHTGSEARDC